MKDLKQAAREFLLRNDTVFRVNSQTINGLCEFAQHLVDKGDLMEAPFNSDVNELYGIIEDLQKTVQSTKYHQSAEVKTLQQCKDEIARTKKYDDWESLRTGFSSYDGLKFVENRSNEAAEMYADQFKATKVITDEDIEAYAYDQGTLSDISIGRKQGAEWYRLKLSNKS